MDTLQMNIFFYKKTFFGSYVILRSIVVYGPSKTTQTPATTVIVYEDMWYSKYVFMYLLQLYVKWCPPFYRISNLEEKFSKP